MHSCETCGQDFKTIQGMLGHQRMKHSGNGAQNSGQFQSNNAQNNGQHQCSVAQNSDQHQSNDGENIQQSGDKLLSRSECLALIDASVKRQVAGMEPHVHDLACDGCRDFLDQYMQENPDFFEPDPVPHDHGDGCPECVAQQQQGGRRSMQRTANYYEGLPGVTEIREHQYIGQQVITIIDDRPTVQTESLDDATFRIVLDGMLADVREKGDRSEFKAGLPEMVEQAGRRGIR